MTPLLDIKDLYIAFATSRGLQHVVHGANLQIFPGETVGLVGESGSGKSVTAQAIIHLLGAAGKITAGEISFRGKPIQNLSASAIRAFRGKQVGMVFQDPMTSLNPTMCIGKQIAEALVYHEKISYKKAREQTIEMLHAVGIADPEQRYHVYPFQLSGGMRQRVLIAMALICRPSLLIADEPTTALDVTIQAQILELLQSTCKKNGMSLLLITHDLGVVASVCERAAVMQNGVIVETASVDNLFASPQHPYTCSLLAARQGLIDATK